MATPRTLPAAPTKEELYKRTRAEENRDAVALKSFIVSYTFLWWDLRVKLILMNYFKKEFEWAFWVSLIYVKQEDFIKNEMETMPNMGAKDERILLVGSTKSCTWYKGKQNRY